MSSASTFARDWGAAAWQASDPENGGTFSLSNKGRATCPIVTEGASETRTLPSPDRQGQVVLLWLDTDAGDVVVTITGGHGVSTITLDDAGDFAMLESITIAGTAKWRLVATGDVSNVLVSESIPLHASKTVYNLFTARETWEVTHIDYVPDVAQGGALTATVVKATSTATPASATTPMHIAAAINLNGTAHTVQPITLTVTTADLRLAVGDRIGLVLSGAMTTGSGLLTIRAKRI